MSCAICEIRKEKRFCPAVHGRICSQCCGEQREVTLDCPRDCPYLVQAHEHERPRSADQIDPAGLFLQVEIADQFMYENEHLLMGLSYALAKAARVDRNLHDQDLIAALSVLSRSYERLVNSGLHYEQPLTSDSQGRAVTEVEAMVKEYREALKSSVADMKNVAGPHGGAITAALILQEFVDDIPWAHLDIAGPAFAETDTAICAKGGTGFGVRTLVRFLLTL